MRRDTQKAAELFISVVVTFTIAGVLFASCLGNIRDSEIRREHLQETRRTACREAGRIWHEDFEHGECWDR